jgi:hypothetical protein
MTIAVMPPLTKADLIARLAEVPGMPTGRALARQAGDQRQRRHLLHACRMNGIAYKLYGFTQLFSQF